MASTSAPPLNDYPVPLDDSEQPTCLSVEDHNHNIRDLVTHYFGCIEICERKSFFDDTNPVWKIEEDKLKKLLEDDLESSNHTVEAKRRVKDLQQKTEASVKDHNNRTQILVREITARSTRNGKQTGDLVDYVKDSHKAWHNSPEFIKGIQEVQNWRRDNDKPIGDTELDGEEEPHTKYSVEEDVNAYIIKYKVPKLIGDPDVTIGSIEGSSIDMADDGKLSDLVAEELLGRGDALTSLEGNRDERLTREAAFLHQRITVARLLEEDPKNVSILSHTHNGNGVRYFHLPSNNMRWAEEAIARYFDEKRPEYDSVGNPKLKNHSSMILRPEFWRGQQSGTYESRHMRPLCERISSDPPSCQKQRKDFVLFMPYLHWETSRAREQISKVLVVQAETQRLKLERLAEDKKSDRKQSLKRLKFPSRGPDISHEDTAKADKQGLVRSLTELMDFVTSTKDNKELISYDRGRPIVEHSPLGQFLLDAARLYEEMHLFRDKRISEDFMTGKATLHPRRTLDQYYYSTLKTTKARDRDQVVYRGTTRDVQRAHKFQEPERAEGLFSKVIEKVNKAKHPRKDTRRWTGHTAKEDEHGCIHCTADVRKVSKVIMVDQLWMWILDEKTIITCFPKRYGFHKHDSSGVHRCIRDRLKTMAPEEMKSIFNLGLIILDECSYTFFDRTRTEHKQPRTMDVFADAIGSINNKSTIGFEHLWHWTEKAGKIYRSKVKHVEALDLHVPLLDICPEGKLQREIKDVIDELDMMIHVVKKQKEVIKRYTKNVERVLDPTGQLQRDISYSQSETRGFSQMPGTTSAPSSSQTFTRGDREQEFSSFQSQSQDLLEELGDRMEELEDLKRNAETTAQSVKDLLDLKQQQAGVVQAWQAVNQADETVSQGRAIMMFTIVTIIFLPMSFISSVFGMNNSDFGDGWTFREQAVRFMIPISTGMIFITLLLGFSDFCRAFLWWLWAHVATFILVCTPLYRIWLHFRDNWGSQALYKSTEKRVTKMKDEVRRARAHRKSERRKAEEARKADERATGGGHVKKSGFFRRKKAGARQESSNWNQNASQGHDTVDGSIPLADLAQPQNGDLRGGATHCDVADRAQYKQQKNRKGSPFWKRTRRQNGQNSTSPV